MSRVVKVGCLLAAVLPLTATAQTRSLQGRAQGEPVGMAIPGLAVAGAEEPTAVEVNPAGAGFVDALTLQYFHEGRTGTDLGGDGVWLASPFGPFVSVLGMQWIRPGDGGGPHFRKTTFGLALPRSQTFSLGVAVNGYASPSRDLDRLWSFDAGLTVRPSRRLSLGASILGLNAAEGGVRLPVRYQLGAAARPWGDRLTLAADLLADDRTRGDLAVLATALAVRAEIVSGLALQGQVQFPVRRGLVGPEGSTYAMLALTFDGGHAGITAAGGGGTGADRTWLVGARLSAQRYRAVPLSASRAPSVDLGDALSTQRSLVIPTDRDAYGELLERLRAIRDDASAAALVVKIDDLPVGQGRVEELRQLLRDVATRKPVAAYLVGGGLKEIYLASAATVVLSPPSASLMPTGLSSTSVFVRDALGRLGITFDVVAVGRFKTAPDPLVRQDMSEAQREVATAILDDVFARRLRGISEGRNLAERRVRELVDRGLFTARQAVEVGLVDEVAWPDDVQAALARRIGRQVHLQRGWDASRPRAAERWGPRRAVGVVRLEGALAPGRSRRAPFGTLGIAGADTITELLRQAAGDPAVVAVVLRVDSPGGDALASDLVWREVVRIRRSGKPVVVSMGDLAASGGYLSAVGADAIVAEPSTLTGSIGVFTLKPDVSGLLAKLSVAEVTLKRGAHGDIRTPVRRWTDEERRAVTQQVQAFYDLFLERVAEGRRLSKEEVARVAAGRVWTGAQARERGLVDVLGTMEDAIRLAWAKAGRPLTEEVELRRFEPPRSLASQVARWLGADADGGPGTALADVLGRVPELRALGWLGEMGPLVAMPEEWLGLEP